MKSLIPKTLFAANYLSLILYMSWNVHEKQTAAATGAPLFISSLMLIDITYISSCNIRDNKVMNLFCGLLALDSWYMVLSFEEGLARQTMLTVLHPLIWYLSVKFILMFLFQGNGYGFKKVTDIFLLITCAGSLGGIFISKRAFACLYGIQFLAGCLCFFFLLICHRKRVTFVLKNEGKSILLSAVFTLLFFSAYCFATMHVKNHIANFGVYLTMLLFLSSVHGILMKENSGYPLSAVFSKKQTMFILLLFLAVSGLITIFAGGRDRSLFIGVNTGFALIYICNIILGQSVPGDKNRMIRDSKYNEALRQFEQEETLKSGFADFLHDDVLQDLLSIKNLMAKACQPEIQDIIVETLDKLNTHIRGQMQDYHPAILNSLTAKENYQNLMEAVSQSFPQRNIMVSFECSHMLFLPLPYNVLVYRLLKELLTNVYKHCDGSRAWVRLSQEKGIIELEVSDNGSACTDSIFQADKKAHRGIATIRERINSLGGSIQFSNNAPQGICVQITLPMKGEDSYQYFVS